MEKINGGEKNRIFQNAAAVYLALNLALNVAVLGKKKTTFSLVTPFHLVVIFKNKSHKYIRQESTIMRNYF